MNAYDKLKELKDSIYTDNLNNKKNEIIENMNDINKDIIDINSYSFKVLINNIYSYFYDLSLAIFDSFVCEGGKDTDNFSYKNFKLFFLTIFYSFIKDFFIENERIKNFFTKIPKNEYYKIYCICEDSLFNFIALYYFENTNEKNKDRIEHILKNIMIYDSNDENKINRYKRIMFIHYKNSECKNINNKINSLKEISKEISREYTQIHKQLKELRGVLLNFKFVKDSISYTKEDLKTKIIIDTKTYLIEINKRYIENEKEIKLNEEKYLNIKNLSQEEFERS